MERTSSVLLLIIRSCLLSSVVTSVQNAAPNTLEAKLRGHPLSMDEVPEFTGDEMFGINEQCSKLNSYQIAFLGGEIFMALKANFIIDTVKKLMVRPSKITNRICLSNKILEIQKSVGSV
jgi:hypothetical protein